MVSLRCGFVDDLKLEGIACRFFHLSRLSMVTMTSGLYIQCANPNDPHIYRSQGNGKMDDDHAIHVTISSSNVSTLESSPRLLCPASPTPRDNLTYKLEVKQRPFLRLPVGSPNIIFRVIQAKPEKKYYIKPPSESRHPFLGKDHGVSVTKHFQEPATIFLERAQICVPGNAVMMLGALFW
jgi:hypothetical protein